MAIVDLTINKYIYQIACDDGQEAHLKGLAKDLDARISKVFSSFPKAGENLILVITALMMIDEIKDQNKASTIDMQDKLDLSVSDTMDMISEYLENIANRVKIS